MLLLGKPAPLFKAKAVIDGGKIVKDFSLEQFIGKKYVVFFTYPLDFSTLCPTEIIAIQNRIKEFDERNCAVVGCSVDSHYSHRAWLKLEQGKGGILGVTYPLVADFSKMISINYGVLAGSYIQNDDGELSFSGIAQSYRGLFVIDKKGIVRYQSVNDMGIGRSVDEILRMVDAIQWADESGEDCPIDWKPKSKSETAS